MKLARVSPIRVTVLYFGHFALTQPEYQVCKPLSDKREAMLDIHVFSLNDYFVKFQSFGLNLSETLSIVWCCVVLWGVWLASATWCQRL